MILGGQGGDVLVTRWLASAELINDVDRVAEEVHRGVLRGWLSPGSELRVRTVCERFAISAEVVDAALSRLVYEGALLRHGNSVLVPGLDRGELHRVHQLRRALEPELGAQALHGMSRSEAMTMQRLAASLTGPQNVEQRMRTVTRWRLAVVAPAATQYELGALRAAWQPLERCSHLAERHPHYVRYQQEMQQTSATQIEAYQRGSPHSLGRTLHDMIDLSEALTELALQHDFQPPPQEATATAQIIELRARQR